MGHFKVIDGFNLNWILDRRSLGHSTLFIQINMRYDYRVSTRRWNMVETKKKRENQRENDSKGIQFPTRDNSVRFKRNPVTTRVPFLTNGRRPNFGQHGGGGVARFFRFVFS